MQLKRRNGRAWLAVYTGMIALGFAIAPGVATAQDESGNLPLGNGGRLWNISDAPFKYRLRRSSGAVWTDVKTLAPGEFQQLRLPKPGERAELEGLDVSDPHLSIEYPELGGLMRFRLPARSSSGTVVPFWFYVKDSNGFGRLIQSAGLKSAQEDQVRLQKAPPLTPEELEHVKATLLANWVYYPARKLSDSTGPRAAPARKVGGSCRNGVVPQP